MSVVTYHETDIPKRPGGDRVHLEVGTGGRTIRLSLDRADGPQSCKAELNIAETKDLVIGLLDAAVGRCGMTLEQRNRFCKALELTRQHPSACCEACKPRATRKAKG